MACRKGLFSSIVFAVLSFITSGALTAATLNVPTDFSGIQAAYDAASDGDVVLVSPGVYSGPLNWTAAKTVSLISTDGAEATVITIPQYSTLMVIDAPTPGTKISGFTFRFPAYGSYVEVSQGSAAITVQNNIFQGFGGSSNGLDIKNDGSLVRRNLFYNGNYCMQVRTEDCQILNNTFADNFGNVIRLYSPAEDVKIRNNIFFNCLGYAIGNNNCTVEYNCFWKYGSVFGNSTIAPGPTNIVADPDLLGPEINDYRLTDSSPCIDAGDPNPLFNDIDGSRNDIGAIPHIVAADAPYPINIHVAGEENGHVLNHAPEIAWNLVLQGGGQISYEATLSYSTDWSEDAFWTSGTVTSMESTFTYPGGTVIDTVSADTLFCFDDPLTPELDSICILWNVVTDTTENPVLADGHRYFVRVRVSDGMATGSWRESSFRMNNLPTTPQPYRPRNNSEFTIDEMSLSCTQAYDFDNDQTTYQFELYTDVELQNLFARISGVAVNSNSYVPNAVTEPIEGIRENPRYWWRTRAYDGFEYSPWSEVFHFRARYPRAFEVPSDFATIQGAVDNTLSGDSIVLAPGLYEESVHFGYARRLNIGPRDGRGTVTWRAGELGGGPINCGADTRLIVEDLTLKARNQIVSGTGANMTFRRCRFAQTDDTPNPRHAIMNYDGSLKVLECTADSIFSQFLGTLMSESHDSLIVERCMFDLTLADYGNAFVFYGDRIVEDEYCLFRSNVIKARPGEFSFLIRRLNPEINSNIFVSAMNLIQAVNSNATFVNNIIIDTSATTMIFEDPANINYNCFYGTPPNPDWGPDNIYTDPLLNDPENGDYTLQCNSPCIDAGTYVGGECFGTAPDIGLEEIEYIKGDLAPSGGEGEVSVTDAVGLINYIFDGAGMPCPLTAADFDCNGTVSITDAVALIGYIFEGTASPCGGCEI